MMELREVADYFDYDIFFFAEDGEPDQTIHSEQFQAIANQTKLDSNRFKIVRKVEQCRDLLINLLEDEEEKPRFTPPDINGDMANKAAIVRDWLGINCKQVKVYNFKEYRHLIEEKGIFVLMSTEYEGEWKVNQPEKMSGFTMTHPQMPVIFITRTSDQQQTFTLFHELGHLLLHRDSFFDDADNFLNSVDSKIEQEANDFSMHCFLTDKNLFGIADSPNQSNIHSDQKGQKLLDIWGARYINAIIDSMYKGDLTLYRACKALGINVADMKKLLRGDQTR